MFAQATDEAAKSFIEKLPDILRAAATSPAAFAALIILAVAVLVFFLFRRSNPKIKLTALGVVVGCVLVLGIIVIYKWNAVQPPPAGSCKVNGFVYNGDVTPAVGLQAVQLSYLSASRPTVPPVQVATTAPNGHFSFDCSKIDPEAFPIRLRASHAGETVESEDALVFADNAEVNLYLSPRAISNHYRLNTEMLRVPSAQLFRKNFVSLTNAASSERLSTNRVLAVPKNLVIPRETIMRLRANSQP